MNLREWMTNDPAAKAAISPDDLIKDTTTKVLGILWNSEEDTISLPRKVAKPEIITKREVLHQIAQIFDPLGLVCPLTIRGKVLLQKLWQQRLDWDDPITEESAREWSSIAEDLKLVNSIKVRRRVITQTKSPIQLLCFTDASSLAYGAVIYIRQVQDGTTNLIFAKARVAPIKPRMTIPRLELLGALIGSRVLRFVEKELRRTVQQKFLWSDSQIVLQWLCSQNLPDPYVERRVTEIKGCGDIIFSYVSSQDNPSDLASRGSRFHALMTSSWFIGPPWIRNSRTEWPNISLPGRDTQISQALTVYNFALSVSPHADPMEPETGPFGIDPAKFSNLRRLLRITAYCNRFVTYLKDPKKERNHYLTAEDITTARLLWIKSTQARLPDNYRKGLCDERPTQTVKKLNLYLENGIIRCGSRFANAMITHDSKFPILLPKKSTFTKLLIFDIHESAHHGGTRSMLSLLRRTYWIPQGLSTVRKHLSSCVPCRRVEGSTFKPPPMANLPAERLCRSPAFFHTGLDYLGPLQVKSTKGKEYEKRWIALFTCFSTRAIHLEVVINCSADAALHAIQRFVARRGTPNTILTDNAAQFTKTKQVLNSIWAEQGSKEIMQKLSKYFSNNEVNWRFIPERSPWYGGFYERLVGLVKKSVRKTLWRATIDDDSLHTLITSIEAILNSRPLLSISPDLGDGNVLTPAHFIAPGIKLSFPPSSVDPRDPDYVPDNSKEELLAKWKQKQRKLDQYWEVWQTQYLQELHDVQVSHFPGEKGQVNRLPKAGEVVIIREKTPRSTWKLAKIERLLSAKDQEPRFVELKFLNGQISRRGVRDIVPLELSPQALAFLGPPLPSTVSVAREYVIKK